MGDWDFPDEDPWDDEGDPDAGFNPVAVHQIPLPATTWKDATGKVWRITEMADEHLANAIRYLQGPRIALRLTAEKTGQDILDLARAEKSEEQQAELQAAIEAYGHANDILDETNAKLAGLEAEAAHRKVDLANWNQKAETLTKLLDRLETGDKRLLSSKEWGLLIRAGRMWAGR